MRAFAGSIMAASAVALTPGADAQTLQSAQAGVGAVLVRIENNLVDAEAIGMNIHDWKTRSDTIQPRVVELGQRYAQENAYCTGTFEHDEYGRRKAACDATFSQLDALKAQLQPEVVAIQEEGVKLQTRETAREAEASALSEQLTKAMTPLVMLCGQMSRDAAARDCHLPPAPGPRTRAMVSEMEARLVKAMTEGR